MVFLHYCEFKDANLWTVYHFAGEEASKIPEL
jgi:hypothetical protein